MSIAAAFNAMLAADAQAISGGEFSEPVILLKGDGRTYSFTAVVWRELPHAVAEAPPSGPNRPFVKTLKIFVSFDATWATGAASIDKGNDRFIVSADVGGKVEPHPIAKVLEQDPGGWLLQLA